MVYLIDFENVHEDGFSAIGRMGDKDAVYCFFTKNVAKVSMSTLASIRSGQLHFIEAESGKQSLDLTLASYLGYLIGTKPQELYYDIISNDNGYAKIADFWNKRGTGLRVRIRKTNEVKVKNDSNKTQQPAANDSRSQPNGSAQQSSENSVIMTGTEPSSAKGVEIDSQSAEATVKKENVIHVAQKTEGVKQAQQKQRGRQRSQRQRGTKQESVKKEPKPLESETVTVQKEIQRDTVPVPVLEAIPTQTANEILTDEKQNPVKQLEPAVAAALESAGVNGAAIEFIQSQAEKYRADKNMKQLVYRAVVKKYGQKKGTQIYNNAKKLLLK